MRAWPPESTLSEADLAQASAGGQLPQFAPTVDYHWQERKRDRESEEVLEGRNTTLPVIPMAHTHTLTNMPGESITEAVGGTTIMNQWRPAQIALIQNPKTIPSLQPSGVCLLSSSRPRTRTVPVCVPFCTRSRMLRLAGHSSLVPGPALPRCSGTVKGTRGQAQATRGTNLSRYLNGPSLAATALIRN